MASSLLECFFNNENSLLIETNRLILEPITTEHVSSMWRLLQDEKLYQFIPQDPPTKEILQKRYSLWQKRKSPDGMEVWLNWAAKEKTTLQYIGHFQSGWDQKNGFSIAYTVGVDYQNNGYGKEAVGSIVKFLKIKLKADAVCAWIDTRNIASIKLVESLGFINSGFIKDADEFKGSKSDEYVYKLNLNHLG